MANVLGETKLLTEYLRDRYGDYAWEVKPRLGATPYSRDVADLDDGERRILENQNRWADAVVILPDSLIVVEATLWDPANKIGQVEQYVELLPHTERFKQYAGRRVLGEIVTAQDDPLARMLIERHGLRYYVYTPPWFDEYLKKYPNRRRRPPLLGLPERAEAGGGASPGP